MEGSIVASPNDTSNMMSYTLVALHKNVAVSPDVTVWFLGGIPPIRERSGHLR